MEFEICKKHGLDENQCKEVIEDFKKIYEDRKMGVDPIKSKFFKTKNFKINIEKYGSEFALIAEPKDDVKIKVYDSWGNKLDYDTVLVDRASSLEEAKKKADETKEVMLLTKENEWKDKVLNDLLVWDIEGCPDTWRGHCEFAIDMTEEGKKLARELGLLK